MSLDGFVAGPNQSVKEPLGVGGEPLHEWAFPLAAFRRIHGMEGGETNASSAEFGRFTGGGWMRHVRACELDGDPSSREIVATCDDGTIYALKLEAAR